MSSQALVQTDDLLTFKADAIVHQINCVTVKAHGLSASIAKRYAYANVYKKRRNATSITVPGSIVICKDLHDYGKETTLQGPDVVGVAGQIAPGKPGAWAKAYKINPDIDTSKKRLAYFKEAMQSLEAHVKHMAKPYLKIAFPWQIGCGLAGGAWKDYEPLIQTFAKNIKEVKTQVYIIKQ